MSQKNRSHRANPMPAPGKPVGSIADRREPLREIQAADRLCAGCHKQITDRFVLRAKGQYWHDDCLRCGCCDCRLGEVGASMFYRANLILCKRDYLRLFGVTGCCSACNEVIPAFEMVMRSRDNVYHLNCFACQLCRHRFCVGDKYYLYENQIVCESDYQLRMFEDQPSGSFGPSSSIPPPHPPQLPIGSELFPPTNELHPGDDGSSGYGSPNSTISESPRF